MANAYEGYIYVNSSETSTKTIGHDRGSNKDGLIFITKDGRIQPSGSKHQAIFLNEKDSNTFLFLNNGTLQGTSDKASVEIGVNNQNGADIGFFFNAGKIGNNVSKFGVVVWGNNNENNKDRSTIYDFTNIGTIEGKNGEAIYLGNTYITTFTNWNSIKSNKKGVNVNLGANIKYFTNIGTIEGEAIALRNDTNGNNSATIENLINFGTIKSNSSNKQIHGINLEKGTKIDNFYNAKSGIITGGNNSKFGILSYDSTINTFKNSGTIESQNGEALYLRNSTITNFENSGSIIGQNYGIQLYGGKITTLTNSGLIKSKENRDQSDKPVQFNYTASALNIQDATIDTFTNSGTLEGIL